MKHKNILFSVLFFVALLPAVAQNIENMAFASQHGIFIKLEDDYPAIDKNNIPEYEIKRKGPDDKNFKSIATVSVPKNYDEFLSNIKVAANVNPEPLLVKEIPAELLWKKFSSGGFDSIATYRNALFIQLALGIKYFDATAKENVTYVYEVTKKIKSTKSETAFVTNSISYPLKPLSYPSALSVSKQSAIAVAMNYDCKGYAPNLVRVYREENYSGKFVPIRAKRIKTMSGDTTSFAIYDTLVKTNNVYRYYILPLDYYGNYGAIKDTVTAIAASSQYAGNVQRMDVVSYFNEGTAIRWQLSQPQNFNYVAIYRTSNFDSTLVKIGMAPASDSQYVDVMAIPMQMYFYAVQPITNAGTLLPMSAKVTGMFTPKAQPLAPYITDITPAQNAIQLTIKSNDPQTRGYRIYRKEKSDTIYTLISELVKANTDKTVFMDSLKLIGGKYYTYLVKAENTSYVLSGSSNILTVRSVLVGTPISIGVPHAEIINNHALVQWKNTIQNTEIANFHLYRKDASGKETLLADAISSQIFNYTDSTIRLNNVYSYGISYSDNDGNNSAIAYSEPIAYTKVEKGPLNVYASSNENKLMLSWSDDDKDVSSYKIYRLVNDKPLLIAEVTGDKTDYTISNVKNGEAYTIYLTSVNKEKQESAAGKMLMGVVK